MVKSPAPKVTTANFSALKLTLRHRSQRAKQRESIINHKRQLFTTHSTTHPPLLHTKFSSKNLLRKNAPLSEEDFSQLVYQLDLEWNSFQIVAKTTERVRKMLSIEVNPPIDKVVRSGAVPYLVQLLDAKEIEKYYTISEQPSKTSITESQLFRLQFEATWAITNIANGTSDHARYIVELGCVPLLIRLLSSDDDTLREQAVWAIGNLAGDSVMLRDYLLKLGAMEPMVGLMKQLYCKLSLQRNAVWAISNLLRSKPIPQWDLVSSAIPLLCDLILKVTDEEVLVDACWSFSYVTDGFSESIPIIMESGATKKIVELLSSSLAVQFPALRTVGNLLTGSAEQTQILISYGVLNQLTKLLDSPKKTLRKEVVWSISNITAGTEEQIQAVIDANLFPKLMEIISSQSEVVLKREALWACANALERGTSNQIRYLIDFGIIVLFCDALTSSDQKTVHVVLEGLAAVLTEAEKDNSWFDKIVEIIQGCGGESKLQLLLGHSDKEIIDTARRVLDFIEIDLSETAIDIAGLVPSQFSGFQF